MILRNSQISRDTFDSLNSFSVSSYSISRRFQARSRRRLERTIPTYVPMIWLTSLILWVINTISSGWRVPSSFQSGTSWRNSYPGAWATACRAAASAYTTASISELMPSGCLRVVPCGCIRPKHTNDVSKTDRPDRRRCRRKDNGQPVPREYNLW